MAKVGLIAVLTIPCWLMGDALGATMNVRLRTRSAALWTMSARVCIGSMIMLGLTFVTFISSNAALAGALIVKIKRIACHRFVPGTMRSSLMESVSNAPPSQMSPERWERPTDLRHRCKASIAYSHAKAACSTCHRRQSRVLRHRHNGLLHRPVYTQMLGEPHMHLADTQVSVVHMHHQSVHVNVGERSPDPAPLAEGEDCKPVKMVDISMGEQTSNAQAATLDRSVPLVDNIVGEQPPEAVVVPLMMILGFLDEVVKEVETTTNGEVRPVAAAVAQVLGVRLLTTQVILEMMKMSLSQGASAAMDAMAGLKAVLIVLVSEWLMTLNCELRRHNGSLKPPNLLLMRLLTRCWPRELERYSIMQLGLSLLVFG